jgi:hypothetical protein
LPPRAEEFTIFPLRGVQKLQSVDGLRRLLYRGPFFLVLGGEALRFTQAGAAGPSARGVLFVMSPRTIIETTRGGAMSQRESTLLWLRDILEHLSTNQQRLEWATDREAIRVLTETMLRDLDRCHRLCQGLHQNCLERSRR